jgi:hypothetical protein
MGRKASFSEKTLRRVAREHVSYELQMMAYLSGAGVVGDADPCLGFSQLEAWLLHVRNLHEFLTTTRVQRDAKGWRNVVAADFMPPGWKPPVRCLTKPRRRRIDKALAHVSADRRAGTSWNRPVITSTVLDVFRRRFFEPYLDHYPRRRGWFALEAADALAVRSQGGDFAVAQLHRVGGEYGVVLPAGGRLLLLAPARS